MKRCILSHSRCARRLYTARFSRCITTPNCSRIELPSIQASTQAPRYDRRPYATYTPSIDDECFKRPLLSSLDSTIYALSTAPGRAGIAIIRISGPACFDIYHSLCPSKPLPKPRHATLRTLYSPTSPANVLDTDALVLHFPSPATVTGEQMLELHIHGGPATVKAVLHAIPSCPSSSPIRYAEPGEFTRRAFQNNRLDLAQVEALSDTLSAETEQQRRAAVRGNSGVLGKTYESWRLQLLEARGEMEALIDFSEDGDFASDAPILLRHIEGGIQEIRASIKIHQDASKRGELLRKGIRISLLGPPNAGKSSLLNRIVDREASIVSTEAGTTRDVVEVSLDIEGYLCTFADTAGLRTRPKSHEEKIGAVEQEGIRRAKAKARESDLVVVLASIEIGVGGEHYISYDADALEIATKAESHLLVINKLDTIPPSQFRALLQAFYAALPADIKTQIPRDQILAISCKPDTTTKTMGSKPAALDTGTIKLLLTTLVSAFKSLTTLPSDDLYGVTERQRQLLTKCDEYLSLYLECTRLEQDSGSRHGTGSRLKGSGSQHHETDRELNIDIDVVLAAEHLRSAGECLGRLTGRGEGGDVEEVLGVVFEKFCVGK